MIDATHILVLATGYFLGAIPSGFIICKHFYNLDIRKHGSGNPGAANVYRTCGKIPGFATLLLDALKGYIPVFLSLQYEPNSLWLAITVGGFAVIGHMWTVFLGFRGGKGVATGAGICACLLPIPTLLAMVAFIAGVALSNHISVGSMLAASMLPIASFALKSPHLLSTGSAILGLLILIRHIPNMRRLITGEELNVRKNKHK
ncbi:glycerol-3-phosphate 1-O-acyltransferase PlsY [Elusimicrobiota bacterium]